MKSITLCVSTIVVSIAIVGPTLFLQAQDSGDLKPLPRFLRNPRLADRYLSTRDIADILQFERAEPVCAQLLKRSGVDKKYRIEALEKLVELHASDPVTELIVGLKSVDLGKSPEVIAELARLLPGLDADAFRKQLNQLDAISSELQSAELRQAIAISSMKADQNVESAWSKAAESEQTLTELLGGLEMLDDDTLRAELFERVVDVVRTSTSDELRAAAIHVAVELPGDMQSLFNLLVDLVAQKQLVGTCLTAIGKIPKEQWDPQRVSTLAQSGLDYVAGLSISERTTNDARQTFALLNQLAGSMSPDSAAAFQRKIQRLTVQEFVVAALPEKMEYDETILIVEAGRPVRIAFRNDDIMPHNLVVGTEPAARVELGLLADEMQSDKNSLAKGYIPDSPMVMHASRLIQPSITDFVEFVAPDPGIYPYVCTFPGHWSKMYGAIKVVSNPEEVRLAQAENLTADDLLGIRKVDWQFETLVAEIDSVASGRSFETGQRWFKQASCYSCHQMRGAGGLVGPDLTKISEKYKKPIEILQHVMEPSKTIEDKYASVTVIDLDGKVHRGIVVKRTQEELVLQENPLESCAPIIIPIDNIDEEVKSPLSPMPDKLVNSIVEQNEVYDLLAYLIAGGDSLDTRFSQ